MEKLIRTLKEIHGGENHQKIEQCYQVLCEMYMQVGDNNQALKLIQKKISIHKALNGADTVDRSLVSYIIELGFVNFRLRKFDDAIQNFKEAEKIYSKMPEGEDKGNPQEFALQIKKYIEEANKQKNAAGASSTKTLRQRLFPDTPVKMAVYATVFAGIAGLVAFAIFKKKN